jgi:uncharacterized membrane protein YfcA
VTSLELALASAAVMTGALVQGSVGFGLGLVAAPLLLLIDSQFIPGPLLTASAVLTLFLTHREWRSVSFSDLKWALSGRVVGVIVAATVLVVTPVEYISIAFGALVLAAVALSASGLHLAPRPSYLVAAGMLSGFMGTTVSVGGPPIALIYQRESGPRIRGTLSAYFTVGVALSLVALRIVGRYGRSELVMALGLLPGILLGFWLSQHTAGVLDKGYTRVAVLVVSAAAAVVAILRQLF